MVVAVAELNMRPHAMDRLFVVYNLDTCKFMIMFLR